MEGGLNLCFVVNLRNSFPFQTLTSWGGTGVGMCLWVQCSCLRGYFTHFIQEPACICFLYKGGFFCFVLFILIIGNNKENLCSKDFRTVVLNLWVATPGMLNDPFPGVTSDHQMFTSRFITVAKPQLQSCNENSFMIGGQHNMRNCIKKSHHQES